MVPRPNIKHVPETSGGGKAAMMLYGVPGSGKTRLIGTGGKGTLILRPPTDHTTSIRTAGVDELVVSDWASMEEAYSFLREGGAEEYKWVWLDSISAFQDAGLDDIWATVIAQKPHRKEYSLDKSEYGVNMHRLGLWVRQFVALANEGRCNVGVTAHPSEAPDPTNDDEMTMMPYVQGRNMPQKICGYMNIVALLDLDRRDAKLRRILRTRASDRYYAKDQFDAFPSGKLIGPDMAKIEAALGLNKTTKRRTSRRKTTNKEQ